MLSIIIVNYRTRELLRQCVESVRNWCPSEQVIVVDNASQDGSVEMLANDFPEVRSIALSENVGFAAGNNAAFPHATGDPILLLNSDAQLIDDSLSQALRYLDDHPEVGAVSTRLLGADGVWQMPAHPFPSLANELRQACRRTIPAAVQSGITDGWLTGTALLLRRSAFEQIGGRLDDDCFMYWEDCDLSARFREAGWELAVVPEAVVKHYGGASGGGADSTRRPDLDAWYLYGQARWYAHHRPTVESIGLWALQALDVVRMFVRSMVRPQRRHDRIRAHTLMMSLWRRIWGSRPPRPGSARQST